MNSNLKSVAHERNSRYLKGLGVTPQNQTCIRDTGQMQSIAGPVHASAVWTDENKNK